VPLSTQGAVALDQCLPDEHEALVSSVSTCIGNLARVLFLVGIFKLVASSLNDCEPPSTDFLFSIM
jgi:hypothetical protein